MRKTFTNIIYNALYQIFLVLVPLITVPYLSRTLGPATYGIYSSVNNTIQFLMVLCVLALTYVGTRTISRVWSKKGRAELTEAFWGLWYFQLIAGILTTILTIFICLVFKIQYWFEIILMLPYLISATLDITWFFQGIASFGKVVLRNIAVKSTSVVLILLLVKSSADLWRYLLIMSVTTMLGAFVFWLDLKKYVDGPVKKFYRFNTTLKAVAILMIPQIATQIYTSLDKPMLSYLSTSVQVSYYDNSQRISNMILGIITSISLVIMPKMAAQNRDEQLPILKKSLEATTMLGAFFAAILMANTKEFVPFFFGDKYIPLTPLMFFFSLTVIMIPMGGVFANQFALANRKDREYTIPVVIGAIVQVALSLVLDHHLGAIGATIAILITELLVLFLRVWIVREYFDLAATFKDVPKYLLLGAITLLVGMLIPGLTSSAFINMAIRSILMTLIFGLLMLKMPFEFNQDIYLLLNKLRRRK
ncbi:MAG: oligosaccharide flippase family protein [Lactobacillus sp.]|nr:oligosaccharide flippase family protein [Lactobacillus sp.]